MVCKNRESLILSRIRRRLPMRIINFGNCKHTIHYIISCFLSVFLLLTVLLGDFVLYAQQSPNDSTANRPSTTGRPRKLELPDFYRLETVSSPAISPDGRFVAYVESRIVE